MRAIIDINGKQYEVEEGRYVQIDHYAGLENEEVVLGNVKMIVAGEESLIGAPYIDGATVTTRVKRHGRGPKILVYKMRCKKGYRRKNGHRQGFTELQVESLDFPGKDKMAATVVAPAQPAKEKVKASAAPKATQAVVEPQAAEPSAPASETPETQA